MQWLKNIALTLMLVSGMACAQMNNPGAPGNVVAGNNLSQSGNIIGISAPVTVANGGTGLAASGIGNNTVLGNVSGSAGNISAISVAGCNGVTQALQFTNGSGFGCNSAIIASNVNGTVAVANGGTGSSTAISVPLTNAVANLTAQTASITSGTLYAVPSSGAGMYMVIIDAICTTAGTGGTVSISAGWNNGAASNTSQTGNMSLTTAGNETVQNFILYSAANQNITYSTTVTGAAGSPAYSLLIRLVYLG
jgi:hypothetical protein